MENEIAMEPEVSLRQAQLFLEKGKYAKADEQLIDYCEWRRVGGFEPDGGDGVAESINDKLENWRDEFTLV